MTLFRFSLLTAWLILVAVSVNAIHKLGFDGGNIFFADFAQPWRAQFNTDFSIHLLLMAAWIARREPNRVAGIVCALFSLFGGAAFSLGYIFAATYRVKKDFRKLLLG